ncbi:MAG: hypothetical protein KAW87_03420, partial [Candidatus Cloacimonetes bacterium]|nr:hypothetical protein [Candidatus Cloacimonadota bacterium]
MNIIVIIIILIVLYWQVKSIFHNKAKLAKTIIVLLLLIFISTPSYALSEFTCIFTMFNPSATNIAFGLESGTANIWDRNPLGVWSNPAKLGYYNGFAYGNTHDSWLEGFIKGIYHDSSYLTFGWNGVGILLPFVNNSGRFGTTLDYGEQEAYDAEGNPFIKFNSYETNSKYAVGINCIELTSRILKNIPQLRNMKQYAELSFGYSLDYIVSGLCPLIPELMDAEGKGKSCAHNFGSLIKINLSKICYEIFKFDNLLEEQQNEFSFNDILNFEVVGGINFINISKAKILYENSEHKQPLPYGNNTAIAGKLSLINLYNLLPKDFRFLCFFNNMFSIYASYDNA